MLMLHNQHRPYTPYAFLRGAMPYIMPRYARYRKIVYAICRARCAARHYAQYIDITRRDIRCCHDKACRRRRFLPSFSPLRRFSRRAAADAISDAFLLSMLMPPLLL